jgi:hypothetical protein
MSRENGVAHTMPRLDVASTSVMFRRSNTLKLADGLGWFSIALGVSELFAGRKLGRAIGMEKHATLLRIYGLREIAVGVGVLLADDDDKGKWIMARVVGDVLDLGTLAMGLGSSNPKRTAAAIATANVGAVTALDVVCAAML